LEKNSQNKQKVTKANALLCPSCCVEYIEVQFDFKVEDVILHNVKALKCPSCDNEVFTPQQIEKIIKKANSVMSG
jgi:YgiT-type zinc finger domain-containing protein